MSATGVAKATAPAVRLTLSTSRETEWEGQQLQIAITRRAYELFEARGGEHGHDWEDWFRAESELVRPMPFVLSDSKQRLSIRMNVLGFEPHELKVSVDPKQVVVSGSKSEATPLAEYPDRAFQVISLPVEVNPDAAAIVFEAGVLKLELFKAATSNAKSRCKSR